jgi:25S rRNA (uracil2634-N3)-methyltransferase
MCITCWQSCLTGYLVLKHYQAESNVIELKRLGATVLHDVNANTMKLHISLKMKQFDRIVFNYPHAGFSGPETQLHVIKYVHSLATFVYYLKSCFIMYYICKVTTVFHVG